MTEMKAGTRFTLFCIHGSADGSRIIGIAQVREKCADDSMRASVVISDTPTGDSWPNTRAGNKAACSWTGFAIHAGA